MFNQKIDMLSSAFLQQCEKKQLQIVTAESCTGGLISAALTQHAGASNYVQGGFVTYSNAMKQEILNVPASFIREFGAVSEQVVIAMAEGALKRCPQANLSVSVSGIAGPGGGSIDKPVGLVWIGVQLRSRRTLARSYHFYGTRNDIQLNTVETAFNLLNFYLN